MRKIMVFGLIFLFCSVLFPAQVKAEAQAIPTISLEEGNVILPGTDVEFVATEGNNIYVVVSYQSQGKYWLFLSKNKGRSWEKLLTRGLPEEEKFIALEISDATIALATTTKVFLSRDGGKTFPSLSGPPGLVERGEAITSLAVAGESVLVGVWHPSQGKTPQEGVYLLGGTSWEWQGMRKDVTAVGFLDGCILAVASDNATTCLNISYLGQRTFWGANWNQFPGCSGWPIEISLTPGQSPKESEILSSKMALSEFDYREGKIYIIYNTRTRQKDDVYKVEFGENWKPEEVQKLSIPKAPELLSLDSIDYDGTATSGTLAVGVTTVEGQQTGERIDGAHVYRLSSVDERGSPPNWENIWMRTGGYTYSSQVSFGPDRKLFVGTSGLASCFGREEGSIIIPISLIDASRGISQLTPSLNFLKDKTLFINSGSRDILKVVLGEDYSLVEVQRVLYAPQGFGGDRIKIIPSDQSLSVFQRGTKRFWVVPSWLAREKEVEIVDVATVDGKIWVAGRDAMLYQDGQRLTSGLNWIQKIEPGPPGKILVVGGVKEDVSDTISLAGGSPKFLPVLPVSSSYPEVAYSPADKFIYCGIDGRLYQLTEDWEAIGGNWQKVKDFERIYKILTTSQGLYIFCQSKVYFSAFPITKESQWTVLGGEELKGYYWSGCQLIRLDEERNLLVLWESGKILLWTHQAKAEVEAQAKAKAEAEAKVKAEADKVKAEAEAKVKAEAEAKAKAEAEAKVKAEADKVKAEAEAKVKAEAEAKAKAEAVKPPPAETKQPPTTEKPPPKVFVREVKPEAFPQGAFVPVAILVLSAGGFIYWVVHSIRRRKKLRP